MTTRYSTKLVLCALLLLSAQNVLAEETTVGVFAFAAQNGADARAADDAFQTFLLEASKIKGYRLITPGDMVAILGEGARPQIESCAKAICAVRLATFFGAEEIIVGAVTKIENSYLYTVKRIQSFTGKSISEFSQTLDFTGSPDDVTKLKQTVADSVSAILPPIKSQLAEDLAKAENMGGTTIAKTDEDKNNKRVYRLSAYAASGLAVVGLGIAGVGLMRYTDAKGDRDDWKDRSQTETFTHDQFNDIKDRGKSGALLTNIGISIAAVSAVAATVFWILSKDSDSKAKQEFESDGEPDQSLKDENQPSQPPPTPSPEQPPPPQIPIKQQQEESSPLPPLVPLEPEAPPMPMQ